MGIRKQMQEEMRWSKESLSKVSHEAYLCTGDDKGPIMREKLPMQE